MAIHEYPMIRVKSKTPGTIEMHDPFGRWMSIEPAKRCVHCGEEKTLSHFHKKVSAKDGYQSWCKECKRKYGMKKHVRKPVSKAGMPDPELARWDVVDLLLELKNRGYSVFVNYKKLKNR